MLDYLKISFAVPFVLLTCALVSPTVSHATGPEAAWGRYSYKSKDLTIEFLWDIEGIRKVRVNGRNYPQTVSGVSENLDNFGSDGVYPFWITFEENEKRANRLHLLLLFDHHKLICVAGLYSETEFQYVPTKESRVKRTKAFQMNFTPLE